MIKQIIDGFRIAKKKKEIQKRILDTVIESLYSGMEIKLNSQSFNKLYIRDNRLYSEIKISPEEALEILTDFADKQADISFELHHYILNKKESKNERRQAEIH